MRKFALILSLALLVVLAAPRPAAAADGVQWVHSLEQALREAKDRGSLIFIAELIDAEASNDAQKEAFRDPVFVKASRDFVCLIANPHMQHGTVEVVEDGEKVRRCRDWPGITCEDHLKAWNDVRKNYADLNTASTGDMKLPFQFIIDADGKQIATIVNGTVEGGFDVIAGPAMAEALKLIVGRFGKGLSADEYEKLKGKLADAEAAEKAKDRPKALKLCAEIVKANEKTSLADRAREIQERIAKSGDAEIEKAMALAAKDPLGAVAALEQIADDYAGTSAAAHAKAKIDELKQKPEVKKALGDLAARKEAEQRMGKAEGFLKRGDYAKAIGAFDDIAKDFDGTPAGEKAKARAAELRADPKIGPAAREQEAEKVCKGWLSMGKSYAQNGMTAQAKAQFERIIKEYPGTSFAEEAAKELEKLK